MYMIDKIKMEMEMDMEDETERVAERVLPITTEKIETPIEAPTSPVNEGFIMNSSTIQLSAM